MRMSLICTATAYCLKKVLCRISCLTYGNHHGSHEVHLAGGFDGGYGGGGGNDGGFMSTQSQFASPAGQEQKKVRHGNVYGNFFKLF